MPDKVMTSKAKKSSFASTSKGNLKAEEFDNGSRIITHREPTDRQLKNASRNVGPGPDGVKSKFGIRGR